MRAQHEEAVAGYRQRVLIAMQETEDALMNLKRRAEQADVQSRLLEAAQEAAKLSDFRYQEGLVNYLEVVDAERSRLQAERTAVQIRAQRLISTVLLIKSLGGSWKEITRVIRRLFSSTVALSGPGGAWANEQFHVCDVSIADTS